MTTTTRFATALALAISCGGCTVHQTEPPPVTGPSAESTSFTILADQVIANVPVTFDGSASTPSSGASQITSFQWTFDDGTGDTGKKVTHTFKRPGAFNVVLATQDDRGRTSSVGRLIQVGIGEVPAGDFVISPVQPLVGDTTSFNASAIKPAFGRTIVSYAWDFGDATTGATGVQATHTYRAAATYIVVLTVTDDAGQQAVFSKNVVVASGNPTALFTFSPATPNAGDTVIFDASTSTAVGSATIVSYTWSLAGVPASGQAVSRVFSTAGTFPVTLTVVDDQGRKGVASQNVVVK